MFNKKENVLEGMIKEYGKPLNQKEVAFLFRVDRKTVAKKPSAFGGIKVGGVYRFFEANIRKVVTKDSIHNKKSPTPNKKSHKIKSQSKPTNQTQVAGRHVKNTGK